MILKKNRLRLGKETYGTKNILQVFQEAFTPYFSQDKADNLMYPKMVMNAAPFRKYAVEKRDVK